MSAVAVRRIAAALLLLAAGVGGCYPVNKPLPRPEDVSSLSAEITPYSYPNDHPDTAKAERTFVVLAFSGGGTRAAAFAYGVLRELEGTPIGAGRTLLDEVDVISSVSGGSFAAAYYGLVPKKEFFERFPEEVLNRKLELGIGLHILAPWNWPRLLSPYFARSDLAAEYYDDAIFEGRTFAQMRRRPFILLNATDIGRGAQFSFIQDHFDRICSDLSAFSVARAVTASSAFPVVFTPLTLKNYGKKKCNYVEPGWIAATLGDPPDTETEVDADVPRNDLDTNPQLYDLAKTWREYEDAGQRSYLHLSDGGLSDNIGLRAVDNAITTRSINILGRIRDIELIAVIVVDAKPFSEPCIDHWQRPSSLFTVLNAAATNPMENYSSDTVERFRQLFQDWKTSVSSDTSRRDGCDQLAERSCRPDGPGASCREKLRADCYEALKTGATRLPDPRLHLIHVRFESIPDERERKSLQGIATRLQLPEREVRSLVDWGAKLLRGSPEFAKLVAEVRGLTRADVPNE